MNIKKIQIITGKGDANIKGCLLPSLDLKLSDIDPTKGSEIASKKIAIETAKPVKKPERPITWL